MADEEGWGICEAGKINQKILAILSNDAAGNYLFVYKQLYTNVRFGARI